MRSSSGGWVSNSRLRRDRRPSSSCRGHRLLDPEVGGGVRRGADDGVVVRQLLERGDEPGRVAGELHAGDVGQGLALAAHRGLHDACDQRREDQQDEAEDGEDRQRPPPSRSSLPRLRPIPNHRKRTPTSEASAMTPTRVTASVETRMS